jgi:HD domain
VLALTTPGALVQDMNPWIGFSARLSLFTGAFFFALSTVEWRPAIERKIIAWQRQLTLVFAVTLLLFAFTAMTSALGHGRHDAASTPAGSAAAGGYDSSNDAYSDHGDYGPGYGTAASTATSATAGSPDDGFGHFGVLVTQPVSRAVTAAALVLLGLVIFRYARLYRVSPIPLVTGFLVSSIFLFQSQVSMSTTQVWHASWWLYHVLLLGAFIATLTGMVLEYSNSGSLRGVVEGLLLRDTIAQLQRGYADVIVALVGAVEAKDVYTRGHTQRVSDLSVRIGKELKLPRERLRVLAQAAMLHDIGKIGVPDSILNKTGPLTPDEFAVVREHPLRGHAIIKDVQSLQAEVGGVRHHHERLDGSGYPDGLVGDQIPIEARIIAVADVYDALTSLRPYRAAWSPERAMELLDQQAGTKLDAGCVMALHRVLAERAALRVASPAVAAAGAD